MDLIEVSIVQWLPADTFPQHAIFVIECSLRGRLYNSSHRYTDFVDLKNRLLEDYGKLRGFEFLTYFPSPSYSHPLKYLGIWPEDHLARRQVVLEAFLRLVVSQPSMQKLRHVRAFLSLDESNGAKSIQGDINREPLAIVQITGWRIVGGWKKFVVFDIETEVEGAVHRAERRYSHFFSLWETLVGDFAFEPGCEFLSLFPKPSYTAPFTRLGFVSSARMDRRALVLQAFLRLVVRVPAMVETLTLRAFLNLSLPPQAGSMAADLFAFKGDLPPMIEDDDDFLSMPAVRTISTMSNSSTSAKAQRRVSSLAPGTNGPSSTTGGEAPSASVGGSGGSGTGQSGGRASRSSSTAARPETPTTTTTTTEATGTIVGDEKVSKWAGLRAAAKLAGGSRSSLTIGDAIVVEDDDGGSEQEPLLSNGGRALPIRPRSANAASLSSTGPSEVQRLDSMRSNQDSAAFDSCSDVSQCAPEDSVVMMPATPDISQLQAEYLEGALPAPRFTQRTEDVTKTTREEEEKEAELARKLLPWVIDSKLTLQSYSALDVHTGTVIVFEHNSPLVTKETRTFAYRATNQYRRYRSDFPDLAGVRLHYALLLFEKAESEEKKNGVFYGNYGAALGDMALLKQSFNKTDSDIEGCLVIAQQKITKAIELTLALKRSASTQNRRSGVSLIAPQPSTSASTASSSSSSSSTTSSATTQAEDDLAARSTRLCFNLGYSLYLHASTFQVLQTPERSRAYLEQASDSFFRTVQEDAKLYVAAYHLGKCILLQAELTETDQLGLTIHRQARDLFAQLAVRKDMPTTLLVDWIRVIARLYAALNPKHWSDLKTGLEQILAIVAGINETFEGKVFEEQLPVYYEVWATLADTQSRIQHYDGGAVQNQAAAHAEERRSLAAYLSRPHDEIVYAGYLTKQGKFVKNLKRRFCVLTTEALSYYESTVSGGGDDKEKGVISLREVVEIRHAKLKNGGGKGKKEWAFTVVLTNRTYVFIADTDAERVHWANIIGQTASGHPPVVPFTTARASAPAQAINLESPSHYLEII